MADKYFKINLVCIFSIIISLSFQFIPFLSEDLKRTISSVSSIILVSCIFIFFYIKRTSRANLVLSSLGILCYVIFIVFFMVKRKLDLEVGLTFLSLSFLIMFYLLYNNLKKDISDQNSIL